LVISEKLRAQVSGLEQAIKNGGDAVNMVKTAEGALNEVHRLLRSMRDLAVHAANTGATDQAGAQADQAQINNAIQTLNMVAKETQFGNRKLLDGSAGIRARINGQAVMSGDFSYSSGMVNGSAISIKIQQPAEKAIMVSGAMASTDAVGYSTGTFLNSLATVDAGSVTLVKTDLSTVAVTWQTGSTVQDIITSINALGSTTTGITASFDSVTGQVLMTKTDETKGPADVLSWTATGGNATGASMATFASTTSVMGSAGQMTLQSASGSQTVSWSATDTVQNLMTAINNLGTSTTGVTASFNTVTQEINLIKSDTSLADGNVVRWTAAGSQASAASTATYGGLASTVTAGSLTLPTGTSGSTTLSWGTGCTVTDVLANINLGSSVTGVTATYINNKITLIKNGPNDTASGVADVLTWNSAGNDAVSTSTATYGSLTSTMGAGTLTLTLTNGSPATIAYSVTSTVNQVMDAINAISGGPSVSGITATYVGNQLQIIKTDGAKGAADTLHWVATGTDFAASRTVTGTDMFALSTTVSGTDVFASSSTVYGRQVFSPTGSAVGTAAMTPNSSVFAATDGYMFINGVKIDYASGDSAQLFIDKVNAKTSLTGATATFNSVTNRIEIKSSDYGSNAKINITNGSIFFGDGTTASNDTGVDISGTVAYASGAASGNVSDPSWSKGLGLVLKDSLGNSIVMREDYGAVMGDYTDQFDLGVNTLRFQVGAYDHQIRDVNIGSVFAEDLGRGAVEDENVSTLDVTTYEGAQNAIKILDDAISNISQLRASLGATQKNVLESSVTSLTIAKENIASSESTIRDTDMAQEVVNMTKNQILQQSGVSMLAQANSTPQTLLKLLQ
jgi:flagellin